MKKLFVEAENGDGCSVKPMTMIIGTRFGWAESTATGFAWVFSNEGQSGVSFVGQQLGRDSWGAQQHDISFFMGQVLAKETEGKRPATRVMINSQFMREV